MRSWCYLLLLCLLKAGVLARVYTRQLSRRVIETKYGKLRGLLVDIPNKNLPAVEAFLGLQYASLLGGQLRFMPPTSPMEKWDGVRVALRFRPACPQRVYTEEELKERLPHGRVEHFKRLAPFLRQQSEECLHLNLYVPLPDLNATTATNEKYPIVIFVHGESYDSGTGNAYDGSVLAGFGQNIVVTLNYRLGALGFMTTGDSNAPGNYGLLDVVAALHWIKDNIGAFGGDPKKITMMGQGYGAAIVNLLMISPVTKDGDLFQRAIIQSGSALSSWAVSKNPLRYTRQLAEHVNCTHHLQNSVALLECFKRIPLQDMVYNGIKPPKYFSGFGPVIDKRSVLPKDVLSLMQKPISHFGKCDLLVGAVKNEGFTYFTQDEVDNGITTTRRDQILRTYVRNVYKFHRQKIFSILLHHYTDWERPVDPKVVRDGLMEMLGDGQIVTPLIELGDFHAAHGKTYVYSFTYPSRLDNYPRWAGGVHGDDMIYTFGAPLADGVAPFPETYTRSERMLSEAVMRFWTNFIKTGDPNNPHPQTSVHGGRVKNKFIQIQWPTFEEKNQKFLHIGMRPTIRHHYRGNKVALWLNLIPKVHVADDLDPSHHLLEEYNNASTFDDGTQPLDMSVYYPRPPTSPGTPPLLSYVITTQQTSPRDPTTRNRGNKRPAHTTILPNKSRGRARPTNATIIAASPGVAATHYKDSALSLSVTIAVGCSLLFLNILVFAGIYYQKDRMRTEQKLYKRELEKEKKDNSLCPQERENLKNNAQETEHSSLSTPPVSMGNLHSTPAPPVVLPKQPIPVLPPHPPGHNPGMHPLMRGGRDDHNRSPQSSGRGGQSSPRHSNFYVKMPEYTKELQYKLKHHSIGDTVKDSNQTNPVTMK